MKKRYIKPQIDIESMEVESFMMVVSGEGTMNGRENRFNDDYWDEEE